MLRPLAAEFPGAVDLRALAESVGVREEWPDDLSIDLTSDPSAPSTQVDSRIPVEGSIVSCAPSSGGDVHRRY